MMQGESPGSYGDQTLAGRGQAASLGWWKIASQTSERIRARG